MFLFIEEVISEENSSNSDDAGSDLINGILDFPLDLKEADCEEDVGEVAGTARPRHASSSSDGTVESNEDNIIDEVTADDLDIEKKSTKTSNGHSGKETFYFYQSSDGMFSEFFFSNYYILTYTFYKLINKW